MKRSLTLVLMTVGLAAGCLKSPPEELGTGGGNSGSGTSASASTSGAGGAAASSSASGVVSPTTLGASVSKDETLSGDIDMPANSTIAAGVTLTLAPGATIHAGNGASLIVKGTLAANGTQAAPVVLQSKAHAGPDGWGGLDVQSGGDAKLTHIAIHDAGVAFTADAGSMFTIDYILVDTSSTILDLSSGGTLGHGQLHGNGAAQAGDPISISSASPKLSDTLVDNANPNTDHISVNGPASAPVFDHMEVTNCHCAFHFNEGKGITISNSYVHTSAYAMMILGGAGTVVTGNNFEMNSINIGDCFGAGSAVATGNYFDTAAFDMSCKGQTNTSPSASQLANVGPRP